ncbi:hypothetical protein INR49_004892 [Caranx melampygus]|nr:hypothetical protein INR49_004892 [Caranx melampygus]
MKHWRHQVAVRDPWSAINWDTFAGFDFIQRCQGNSRAIRAKSLLFRLGAVLWSRQLLHRRVF